MAKNIRISGPNWILILSFFVSGLFLGGLAIYLWIGSTFPAAVSIRSSGSKYQYINPLLGTDITSRGFLYDKTLDLKLQALINKFQANKSLNSASIYFRDINSGNWVGINEVDIFSPGKLLKIPIMIAYFKLAEQRPEILEKEVEVRSDELYKNQEIFVTKEPLLVGQKYAVGDLIEKMIVDYNSTAANVLFDNIDKNTLNEVFYDLGINFKEDKEMLDFMPLKLYSLFFRVLYNATYLNEEFSEKALKLLVDTPDNVGFGLPPNIPIANLTGVRVLTTDNNEKNYELYNCGIVYYAKHPYDLCAVVRGKDLNVTKDFLNKAGGIVLEEMQFKYEK